MNKASLALLQNGTIVTAIKTKLLTSNSICPAQSRLFETHHQQKTGGLASCQQWSPEKGKGKEQEDTWQVENKGRSTFAIGNKKIGRKEIFPFPLSP